MRHCCTLLIFMVLNLVVVNAQLPAGKIPDFQFFKQDGKPFKTADLNKYQTKAFVFFDADCDHCQTAFAYLNKHHHALNKVSLYFVTLSPEIRIQQFFTSFGSQLKTKKNALILLDKNNQFITKFGPKKYPSMFIYNKMGNLLYYNDDEKLTNVFVQKIIQFSETK